MKKEFICIVCPRGCRITVDESMHISGNQCPRGKTYVESELKDPRRILTTTVRTSFKERPRVSCKTNQPIPKHLIFKAMEIINQVNIDQPLNIGDVIIKDILQTGVDVVLTKSIEIEEKQ